MRFPPFGGGVSRDPSGLSVIGGGALADPPVVTSVTPATGSLAGGTPLSNIAGTGFQNGCTATLGGAPLAVAFVSSTKLTAAGTPAHAVGAVNLVITNPDGQTSGASGNAKYTYISPGIDPATLNARMYYDGADYVPASGLWPGRASLGNSGDATRIAYQATVGQRPTAGAALNGIQTVRFTRASNQFLHVDKGVITYPWPSANENLDWTAFVLLDWVATGAPNNPIDAAYDNEAIVSDFGGNRINLALRPGHGQMLVDPAGSGARVGVETASLVAGAPQLLTARGKSTDLQIRNGSDAFVALGSNGRTTCVLGDNLVIGLSSNPPGAPIAADLACLVVVIGYLDLATCDGVKQFLNNRWGQNL